MEKIICSAIHFNDGIKHEHQPVNIDTGVVICGRRHHNIYMIISIIADKCGTHPKLKKVFAGFNEEQGFLTDLDRFVDRYEAKQVAINARQLLDPSVPKETMLFSEDLF